MANPNPIPHPFLLNPGTRQGDRHLMALNPDHIKIDDRKLGELLVYLHEFASQINFYDLQLGLHDWQRFFATSLPFQLARLQHLALNEQSASITTAIELVRTEPQKEHLVPVFQEIYQDHFAFLHQLSLRLNVANHSFAPILDRLIASNLQEPLKQYIAHCNCLSDQGLEVGVDLNPLLESEIWGLELIDLYSRPASCFENGPDAVEDILKMVSALEDIQSMSESVLGQTQNQLLAIDGYLQESLIPLQEAQRQKHDPQLGLLFTFLELFSQFQGHLNQLSRAHLDYFFKTVLGIKTRSAKPDEAIVVFELQQHIDQYKLDKGRLVQDATDANDADIVFALDAEIVLDKAKAVSFRALHVNQIVSGEARLVEGVYVAPDITKADGKEEDFKGDGPHSWPTLGGKVSKFLPPVDPETETASFQNYDRAQQGFVLASSALFLQEGERTISFSFVSEKLDQESLVFLQELFALNNDGTFVKKTIDSTGHPIDRWAPTPLISNDPILNPSLKKRHALPQIVPGTYYKVNFDPLIPEAQLVTASLPFSIMLSGAESWLELMPEHFKAFDLGFCSLDGIGAEDRFCMLLTVALPPEFPAITFADPEVLVDDFQTHLPLAKIELRPDFKIVCLPSGAEAEACCLDNKVDPNAAEVSLYHYLRDLKFCKTEINVKVCGVRNIVVQNDENLQDINSLVYPFGVRPTVSEIMIADDAAPPEIEDLLGSNFFVGSKEVFCKNWKGLQMNINWKDLPDDFLLETQLSYHYYSGYEDFTVRPQFLGVQYDNFLFKASLLEDGNWKRESNISPSVIASPPEKLGKRKLFFSSNIVQAQVDMNCQRADEFQQVLFFEHEDFNNARDIAKPLPIEPIDELTVNSREAFLRFTLKNQDFQHRRYPFILARQMIAFGKFQDDEKLVFSAVYGYDENGIVQTFVNTGSNAPDDFGQANTPDFVSAVQAVQRIQVTSSRLDTKIDLFKNEFVQIELDNVVNQNDISSTPVADLNTRQFIQLKIAEGLSTSLGSTLIDIDAITNSVADSIKIELEPKLFNSATPGDSIITDLIRSGIVTIFNSASAQQVLAVTVQDIVNIVADAFDSSAPITSIRTNILNLMEGYATAILVSASSTDEIFNRLNNGNALILNAATPPANPDATAIKTIILQALAAIDGNYFSTNDTNDLIDRISELLGENGQSNASANSLRGLLKSKIEELFGSGDINQADLAGTINTTVNTIAENISTAILNVIGVASDLGTLDHFRTDLKLLLENAINNSFTIDGLLTEIGTIIETEIGVGIELAKINDAFKELVLISPDDCSDLSSLIQNGQASTFESLYVDLLALINISKGILTEEQNSQNIKSLDVLITQMQELSLNIIRGTSASTTNAYDLSLECLSICDLSKLMNMLVELASLALPSSVDQFVIIPNEPYTPIIKDLSLDYTAVATSEKGEIDLIQLLPFAQSWQKAPLPAAECSNDDNSLAYPTLLASFHDEGTLFIGVQNLTPGSILNLYFQMAEATADSEYDSTEIQWAYIKDNQWQVLRDQFQVLEDGTQGFTRSGIVKIAVPGDISAENVTLLPPTEEPLYWFKASAERNTAAICETIAVYAQAVKVSASLQPSNDANRLAEPLPKESLDKLAQADSAINTVVQPDDSKGGAPPEEDDSNNYYTRVSERLRHKDRGVNAFDYERIVLEAFPSIYTVKCITHSMSLPGSTYRQDLHLAPGFVSLALIPDLNILKSANSATPKASISLLNEIKDHLQSRVSPFVQLKVVNPRYEAVNIDVDVQFHVGLNASFYLKELAREIRLHLTPWLNGDQSKLCFAHGASQSDLVGFVESRPYVDFISCVNMQHEEAAATEAAIAAKKTELEEAEQKGDQTAVKELEAELEKLNAFTAECAKAYIDIEGQISPRTARSILLAGTITTRQFAEIYCERYQTPNNSQLQ